MAGIGVITIPYFIECRACGHGWQGIGLCCPHCDSVTVDVKSYTIRLFTEIGEANKVELRKNEHRDADGNIYRTNDYGCLSCFEGFDLDDERYDGIHCPACGSEDILQSKSV